MKNLLKTLILLVVYMTTSSSINAQKSTPSSPGYNDLTEQKCATMQRWSAASRMDSSYVIRALQFEDRFMKSENSMFSKKISPMEHAVAGKTKQLRTNGILSLCGYDNTYSASIAAPTVINQTVSPSPNCTFGGEYVTVTNMIAGRIYEISTCSNSGFDTQITIYPRGGGQAVAMNDDWCNTNSVIYFNPLVSGSYDILIDEYDCMDNTICASLDVTLFYTPRPVVTIPTVVHVLYNNSTQNISDAQIYSQIAVLNSDFRRHNSSINSTPAAFRGCSDDPLIEFCLAQQDPNGNPTNGITRNFTSTSSFGMNDAMKFASSGGVDAWNSDDYLNIWVCELSGTTLGYATFPWDQSSAPAQDGVVIDYQYFGTTGTTMAPYDLGKTSTHEVGHWLGLRHIWGDEPNCAVDDSVSDTPMQEDRTQGYPGFPLLDNCSPNYPGVMFYNYMDYSDDAALTLFTTDQSARMDQALFGDRLGLLTSTGCQPSTTGIATQLANEFLFEIYPNPSTDGSLTIKAAREIREIAISNSLGQVVYKSNPNTKQTHVSIEKSGIYYLTIKDAANGTATKRIVIGF